jgi:hypothetical protein
MTRPARVLPRRWAIGLVSLLVVGLSIACGALTGGPATPRPTQAQPTGAATAGATPGGLATAATADTQPTSAATAAATQPPLSTQPGELVLEQNVVLGPGTFVYTDTRTGLAALSSYSAQLVVTFAGTRDGQAEQWTKTYVLLASNDPPARQWTIETAGDPATPGTQFLAELEGTTYDRRGKAACTAAAIEAGSSLTERLELASLLTGVIGADEAGAETINEVAAVHYTFDQRALAEDGLTESTGELWVAVEGGYLVKYVLTSAGGADYFGEGVEGTLTLDYALTGINQPVTIGVPADCPPGMVEAPLLPDASNVVRAPGLLAYDTAADLAAATAFYQEQLPGLGWAADGEPASTDAATVLSFTQGDRQMTVRLSAEAGLTTVTLVAARLGE